MNKLCQQVIKMALDANHGKADGLEVTVEGANYMASRFASDSITQNQSWNDLTVSVRAIIGKRQARLSSNQTSPQALKQLVEETIATTRLCTEDADLLPLYPPDLNHRPDNVNRLDPSIASLTPDDLSSGILAMVDVARAAQLGSSGIVSSGTSFKAIGNSKGLFEFYEGNELECSVTMTGADSSGWAKAVTAYKGVSFHDLAQTAANKAVASANPVEIKPGHYTVILEPAAVLDLLTFLWEEFTGTRHQDKLSCFLNKVGHKVFGKNITIYDDVTHPEQWGESFDGEGVPRQTLPLVKNGVIANLVYGRRSAQALGVQPTGHGLSEPNSTGEYPVNLVIAGGNSTVEEMIRNLNHGLLLTRVWYVREVDPATKIVTGMTRDGTFMIENGQITRGIKNLRFNVSLIEMLNKVVALGKAVSTAGEEGFPAIVPPMVVEGFNFASTTRF